MWLFSSGLCKRVKTGWVADKPEPHQLADPSAKKRQLKAADAKLFVKEKGNNEAISFFGGYEPPSGQNRFFVYDFKKDTLQSSGLDTPGGFNQYWLKGRKYGNTIGCGSTSLENIRSAIRIMKDLALPVNSMVKIKPVTKHSKDL